MPSSLYMLNIYLSALSWIIRKYSFTMYYYVDLRHALFLAINIVKSQVGSSTWVWVPFNTIAHPTSTKTFILSLLLLVIPFTSIKVPVACSVDTGHIIVRLGKFDPYLTVSLVASIVFPQALFWYTYPNYYTDLVLVFLASICVWVLSVLAAKCSYYYSRH